ncbi:protein DCL, chloroplastic [Asparagus officinalis]|uniref:protein DCL, chloroplastic n=1 Tax=Asparagus officinalis TaxID=4686 RepID=UPI00098E3893|nr:protein DCL, chloroplastic [Asparagus officinalis]
MILQLRRPAAENSPATAKPPYPPPERAESAAKSWADHPDYRRWKDREEEILKDIQPITILTKYILHSDRYMDGECLCPDDEKEVVEKLLAYHPRSEDKIGCGLASIMVDRHPTFKKSRCLFVVRTDGVWIDFSYQKCLRAYIREKYPSYAEKFIREHFKRT